MPPPISAPSDMLSHFQNLERPVADLQNRSADVDDNRIAREQCDARKSAKARKAIVENDGLVGLIAVQCRDKGAEIIWQTIDFNARTKQIPLPFNAQKF